MPPTQPLQADPLPAFPQNNDFFSGPSMSQQNAPDMFAQENNAPGFDFGGQPNLAGGFPVADQQPEYGKVADDMFGDFSVTQSMDNMNLNNQSQQNQ